MKNIILTLKILVKSVITVLFIIALIKFVMFM